ncbi:MAG TPA: HD domain-containing phosphohydrolase [Solirubrobacteraceae bacterium]|jgi:GAF domain-containing protein|nr:HD domain-containing phosphohydrolase [Solirubrobacteraceae bacterium]
MRRRSPEATDSWRAVLAVLGRDDGYESRLQALLGLAVEAAGLPDGYLYLAEEDARRLHLEATRARPAGDPSRAAPGPMAQTVEGGAEWIAPTPPLEIVRADDIAEARTLTTSVGRLYSQPLTREGTLIGLVQVGPVPTGDAPARVRQTLGELAFPLGVAVDRARSEHMLRQQLAAASAREEMGKRLAGSALDATRFLDLLLDLALKATRAEGGFVAVLEPESGRLELRADRNMPEDFDQRVDLSPEDGLFDWSIGAEVGALIMRDFEQAQALGIRSILAVPLLEGGQPLGIFALASFTEGQPVGAEGLDLLETYATQATLMLHDRRLFESFSERYLDTVRGLARSLDARRPYLRHHHDRVAALAVTVGRAMGLAEADLRGLRTAGEIHDVGMAGVGDDETAFEANLEHPVVGATMVEHLPLDPGVAGAIATHHEWYDGWGFPAGLRGEAIPLPGSVLALAEFLIEMATDSPLREAWDAERLLDELAQRRGSQFDPAVVDVTVPLLTDDELGLFLEQPTTPEEA